jgi:oligosaccharyltransferase complex subunit alpha (ribophorin I)
LHGEIESYTQGQLNVDGQPDPTKSGTVLTYGPYQEQPPTTISEKISVHFEYTAPITYVDSLERDIEVSHWGSNVAIEERYKLTNHAARYVVSCLV